MFLCRPGLELRPHVLNFLFAEVDVLGCTPDVPAQGALVTHDRREAHGVAHMGMSKATIRPEDRPQSVHVAGLLKKILCKVNTFSHASRVFSRSSGPKLFTGGPHWGLEEAACLNFLFGPLRVGVDQANPLPQLFATGEKFFPTFDTPAGGLT